jgi:hypothetical protein
MSTRPYSRAVRSTNKLLAQRPAVYRGGVAKAGVNELGETEEEAFQLDALKEALRRFGTVGMKKIPQDVLIVAINQVITEWDDWLEAEWNRKQLLRLPEAKKLM